MTTFYLRFFAQSRSLFSLYVPRTPAVGSEMFCLCFRLIISLEVLGMAVWIDSDFVRGSYKNGSRGSRWKCMVRILYSRPVLCSFPVPVLSVVTSLSTMAVLSSNHTSIYC